MNLNIVKVILLTFSFCSLSFGYVPYNRSEKNITSLVGLNKEENFSLYEPTYFIFGKNDLKLQFSFKYRLVKSIPLFFGFTQEMYWSIYKNSKPFRDINYRPEVFYRLLHEVDSSFNTLDIGYMHTSNGKSDKESRSIDRILLRTIYLTSFNRHDLDFNFSIFKIYNQEKNNYDISKHVGFWDLKMIFTKLVVNNQDSLDLETKIHPGSKTFDFSNGSYLIGLIYNFNSRNFNPAIYLQHFHGYAENLLDYNLIHDEYRLGFLLSY